jgi:O-antigen/teichoic acid export membrane protein
MTGAALRADWRHAFTMQRLRQLWYMPLLSFAMGLMLVRTLVMARLLDLHGFAQFSGGLLVSSTFCMLACLGLQPLLQRELPVQIIRRREIAGQVLIAQCLLVAAVCAALGLLAAATGFSAAGLDPASLALGVLHGLSQQVFLIATVESRSRGEPLRFAKQNLLRSLAVLGAGVWAAVATGSATWVLSAEAFATLVLTQGTLHTLWRRTRFRGGAVCRLALRRLGHLSWSSMLALLTVTTTGFVLLNADRWAAAELLASPRFAQYAFAWMLLMVAQSVQVVFNASVFPLLARRFANFGRAGAFRVCARVSFALLLIGILLAAPTMWALDAAIERWFPAYSATRALLPLFLLVAILRVSDFWSSFLIIVGLERRLLLIGVIVGTLVAGSWAAWIRPWSTEVQLTQLAALAAALALCGYASTLLGAWHAVRR